MTAPDRSPRKLSEWPPEVWVSDITGASFAPTKPHVTPDKRDPNGINRSLVVTLWVSIYLFVRQ